MRIDLTCPVELWHYALPTPQYPVCRLQLFNLTEQCVASVQAVFACYDKDGALLSRQVERVQGLTGQGRSAFEMAVEVDGGASAAGMDFSIEKVWFEDGTVWRHAGSNVSEYTPNFLPAGRRLDVLRYLAGPDALGFPSDQGAVWMCVCGRPNSASEDICRRCGRQKREVFTRFNEATVEKVIFEHENAMEEKARRERAQALKEAEEKEALRLKKRRRRRRIIWSSAGTVCVLVLGFGAYFHAVPFYRYYTASRQLENGVYATAKSGFDALAAQCGRRSLPIRIPAIGLDVDLLDISLYYSSAELSKECVYRQAGDMLRTGTVPALKTAQDDFDALGAYRDSASMAQEARYQRAALLLASRQYESAAALYDEIASYRDAYERRQEAVYQWAEQDLEALSYDGAREKFLSLGQYSDAERKASMCLYLPGQAALEAGEYLKAIELFSQLAPEFENTAARLQQAHYGAANMYFEQADYETAAEYYLLAGDYLDSYTQATACLYEPACVLMEEGAYSQAKEMFDKIPAYRDAQEKSYQCSTEMGRIAMEAGDYEGARELLAVATEYEAAQELWLECTYLPAVALQEIGDADGAEALLETIAGYKDSEERLNEIRYGKAIAMMNAREYAQAMDAFAALGDYRESRDELLNARYGYALQLIDSGEYERAVAAFTELDGYLSSEENISKAQYLWGVQRQELEDIAGAAACFRAAGNYEDAAARYDECMYALAQTAIAEEQHEQAAQYLAEIPDYADAELLRRQSVYLTAEARQEAGDLSGAAALFASISGHEDAQERAAACYDAYYREAYTTAKRAMEAGDYAVAVSALESVSRENASEEYADIDAVYKEANYRCANALFEDKKPYEALRYYRNIPGYRDVDKKLDRVCYRIIGEWTSVKGTVMVFRDDGTCTIDGRDYYYRAATYAFYVGDQPDELNNAWTIYSCQGKNLSIENNKTKSQYKLVRTQQ